MIPVHDTPFVAGSSVLPDRQGVEQLIVLFKATYDLSPNGALEPAEEQDPIVAYDELRGDPTTTSIAREAETMPPKPLGTDVFLVGHAVAAKGGTQQMEVRLRLGPVDKRAMVFGTRVWSDAGLGATPSDPQPFDRIPLIYEHAFGGEDQSPEDEAQWEGEARNPIGRGFRAKKTRTEWLHSLLPNIEHPDALLRSPDDRPAPVGFGPIGRHWQPRLQYTGTYDERWVQERAPLLPDDFDERFHHAAPPDQIVAGHVQGGEPVDVLGCTAEGLLRFVLPALRPTAQVRLLLRDEALELRCESVTIDTDRMKLLLLYKAALALPGDLLDVREIRIELEGDPP